MPKSIFISYSWSTKEIADKIVSDLSFIGIRAFKDNLDIKGFDSIKNFMERIKSCDYALIILSDNYLKSRNCLYEILKLYEKDENLKNILPVTAMDLKIFNIEEHLVYTKYWQKKTKKLKKKLKTIDTINSIDILKEIKIHEDISIRVGDFLSKVASKKTINYKDLVLNNYVDILEAIGYSNEIVLVAKALNILNVEDLEKRIKQLNKYESMYGANSFSYLVRARTSKELRNYDDAKRNYELSIKLFPENFSALNSYGYMIDYDLQNHNDAIQYYKSSIAVNPYCSASRLNLGCAYDKQEEYLLAKEQYEEVLKYDPKNEKAHNNLGSLYKSKFDKPDLAEFHLKKALEINPKYIDALINYGNFLKLQGEIEQGNKYYRKAKKMMNNKEGRKFMDTLINSKKG